MAANIKKESPNFLKPSFDKWLRELDLNQRPSGYEGLFGTKSFVKTYFTLFQNSLKINIYNISTDILFNQYFTLINYDFYNYGNKMGTI